MDNNSNQTPKKPSREIFQLRFRGVYTRFYFFLVSSCKISIRESSVTRLRIYNFPLWTEQKKENIESTNSIQIDSFAEEKSHPANCRKITPTSLDPTLLSLSLSFSNPLLSTPSSEPFNQMRVIDRIDVEFVITPRLVDRYLGRRRPHNPRGHYDYASITGWALNRNKINPVAGSRERR